MAEITAERRKFAKSITPALVELNRLQRIASNAEDAARNYERGVLSALGDDYEIYSMYGCDKSPIGKCVYNTAMHHNVGHRVCIFCGYDDFTM